MVSSIFIPFFTILLAEFFDKSQIALLLLATKTRRHLPLLLGALLSFAIVDGTAILFGSFLTTLVPTVYIKIIAAVVFFFFGISMLRAKDEEKKSVISKKGAFFSALSIIFLSEWGDKTQIASALFATRFPPLFVFLGVMAAMLLLSLLAIYVGASLVKKVPQHTIHKAAGIIFLLLGAMFLFVK